MIKIIKEQRDDFIGWNNWFDRIYKPNLDQRWPTMKVALNLLYQMNRPVNILETGCVRQEHDWGSGMSTLIFAEYLQRYGGRLTTIDNALAHMLVCKSVTKEYSHIIKYVVEDSLVELERMVNEDGLTIDLLYLDSMDCPLDGTSAWPSQEHALKEFKAAKPMLHSKSVVLIDDIGFENGGKGKLLNNVLEGLGWTCLLSHQQALWINR